MERTIPLENAGDAQRLFGMYDANVKQIREKTGARITVRNGAIHVIGNRPEVDAAVKAFSKVREILDARGELAEDDLEQILNPRTRPREVTPAGHVPGTIFRRFAEIEAKSEGQKKYLAEIDANDIVFSIGPAGTGKKIGRAHV